MKTFKPADWDADATEDSTYQDLFKATQKKKKRDKPKISDGKIKKDKKHDKNLKKLLKELNVDLKLSKTTNERDLTKNGSGLTKSEKKKLRKFRKQVEQKNSGVQESNKSNESLLSSIIDDRKDQKKTKESIEKKYSSTSVCEEKSFENAISKTEKYLLKQYLELNNLNTVPNKEEIELLVQKRKQKKLKKILEKVSKKQILLSKIMASPLEKKAENKDKEKKKKPKKIKEEVPVVVPSANTNSQNSSEKKKKKKHKKNRSEQTFPERLLDVHDPEKKPEDAISNYLKTKKKQKIREKLKHVISEEVKKKPILSLRQKMMEKLKAARFRFLNEQIYTTDSKEAQRIFRSDPDAFKAYHEGYRQQIKSWPLNPLEVIIKSIQKMPKSHIIADFGCGDARLSRVVDQHVHSFDLVAANESVTACDMAHVPLKDGSVDVTVFCLSLMGTNLHDYLLEANRVLKVGGLLKIAEVESRFDHIETFIEGVQRFGFKKTWKDLSHNLFYFLDFRKEHNVKNKNKLPTLSLLPCLYKKR